MTCPDCKKNVDYAGTLEREIENAYGICDSPVECETYLRGCVMRIIARRGPKSENEKSQFQRQGADSPTGAFIATSTEPADPAPQSGQSAAPSDEPQPSAQSAPATHKRVPRVPTEAMIDALDDCLADCQDSRQALMLAIDAAPTENGIFTLIQVLRSGEQADADGVMVKVSRQACEEAAALLEARNGDSLSNVSEVKP